MPVTIESRFWSPLTVLLKHPYCKQLKPIIEIICCVCMALSSLAKYFGLLIVAGCLGSAALILFWHYGSQSHVLVEDKSVHSSLPRFHPKLWKEKTSTQLGDKLKKIAVNDTKLLWDKGSLLWDKGSFCDEFLHRTFQQPVSVCVNNGTKSSVNCYGSQYSKKMIQCSIDNSLVKPQLLYSAMTTQKIVGSNAIAILDASKSQPHPSACNKANMDGLSRATEQRDHVKLMIEDAVMHSSVLKPEHCHSWINETTFLFRGIDAHIYFEFLSWYNLYKSIIDEGSPTSLQIIRMPVNTFKCRFAEFEQRLFPNVTVLQNMSDKPVCFRRLVLVPSCYASLFFKCKGESDLLSSCLNCHGKGRSETEFQRFRYHVLKVCLIDDSLPTSSYRSPKNIIVILRKPYKRTPTDDTSRFERILSNGDEMVSQIKAKFHTINVTVIYPENLTICQQIAAAQGADILIGVHGAGLVHSWWLRDSALLFELVPMEQLSNPTFKMLCALTGRNYIDYHVPSGSPLTVNIDDVINILTKVQINGI